MYRTAIFALMLFLGSSARTEAYEHTIECGLHDGEGIGKQHITYMFSWEPDSGSKEMTHQIVCKGKTPDKLTVHTFTCDQTFVWSLPPGIKYFSSSKNFGQVFIYVPSKKSTKLTLFCGPSPKST